MSYPFEPTTTKKLREFLKEYLEENCKSPETDREAEQSTHLKNRNRLTILNRILSTWGQHQIDS